MLNVEVLLQPAALRATTLIEPVIADSVLFVAVKAGMLPVPLATKPMFEFELVQLKVVDASELLKDRGPIALPGQVVIALGMVTSNGGLKVIV
jgi:hypothetical protein